MSPYFVQFYARQIFMKLYNFITVGQCGNQIGCRFWDIALREHANVNKVRVIDCK